MNQENANINVKCQRRTKALFMLMSMIEIKADTMKKLMYNCSNSDSDPEVRP